jgi:putative acetyltransferase
VLQIRPESSANYAAIREVNRLAFGRDAEARLVDQLRDEGHARLSLVAEDDGRAIGHILFSALLIQREFDMVEALALAPVAVVPDRQRQGVGAALVRAGLERCRVLGHGIVVVLGDPAWYPRFGFSAELAAPLTCEYSGPALMALELTAGALSGVVGELQYPAPFRRV